MKNIGKTEKMVRITVGTTLIVVGIVLQMQGSGFGWLALVGLIPLVTGLRSSCPLYTALGISTNKDKNQDL